MFVAVARVLPAAARIGLTGAAMDSVCPLPAR